MAVWTGYLNNFLKKNLDLAKQIIKDDWDMVFAVDGYEGSGKSVLAQQCAKYCDPSFDISRVCFTPKEFLKAINTSEKYQAVVYDEAYDGMSSRASMMEVNRTLMGALAEIRQKNLFVFIVLPCFFELDRYAAVWRSRALLHVYTDKGFKRGRFAFYGQERKKNLYVLGKKFYSYKRPGPDFLGNFVNGYAVDENLYREAKTKALKARERSISAVETRIEKELRVQRNMLLLKLLTFNVKQSEAASLIGVSTRQIRRIIAGEKEN